MLVHLVDVSSATGRDPVDDLDTVRKELELFQPALAAKPQIVVANKIDAVDRSTRTPSPRSSSARRSSDLPFLRISGVTGEGLPDLLEAMWRGLRRGTSSRPHDRVMPDASPRHPRRHVRSHSLRPPRRWRDAAHARARADRAAPGPLEHPAAPAAAADLALPSIRDGGDRRRRTVPDWRAADLELRVRRRRRTRRARSHASTTSGYQPTELFFVIGADAFVEIAVVEGLPEHPRRRAFRRGLAARRCRCAQVPERLPHLARADGDHARSTRWRSAIPLIILIDAPTADVSSTAIRRAPGGGRIDRRAWSGRACSNTLSSTDFTLRRRRDAARSTRRGQSPAGRLHGQD